MALVDLATLITSAAVGRRLLGLDVGTKTIGLAVSDPSWCIASPLTTIIRTKWPQDLAALAKIITERDIGGLVLGLPRNMDGSEGPRAQSVRALANNLLARPDSIGANVPLLFWDERLSTAAVERFLIADDMTRKRRDEVIDKLAAAYILQGALDAIRTAQNNGQSG
jgi:putative holliday junction resolvase